MSTTSTPAHEGGTAGDQYSYREFVLYFLRLGTLGFGDLSLSQAICSET